MAIERASLRPSMLHRPNRKYINRRQGLHRENEISKSASVRRWLRERTLPSAEEKTLMVKREPPPRLRPTASHQCRHAAFGPLSSTSVSICSSKAGSRAQEPLHITPLHLCLRLAHVNERGGLSVPYVFSSLRAYVRPTLAQSRAEEYTDLAALLL